MEPVLASQFEGQRRVHSATLRKAGGAARLGKGWTFPDGSTLVHIRGAWRALAPIKRRRA